MYKQSKLRTNVITPNENKSFSVGTMLTVDDWYERLNLTAVIGRRKDRGIPIDPLVRGMLAYQLGDNFSVLQAGEWMNRTEVREHYDLPGFNVKTLYRAVETLGRNRERIVRELQDAVLKLLDVPSTDVLIDWTSIVYYGDMAFLAKYGYSRDHRPDKKQVTVGVAQLAPPVNVPIALTVEAGNINDQEHFRRTYDQARNVLEDSSLVIFDKGANDKKNLESIVLDRNDYLTSKKLNIADDRVFASFDESWERIDDGVYALKRVFPSRVNYYFFSEKLKGDHLASRRRKAERLLAEARTIQQSLDEGKRRGCRSGSASTILSLTFATTTRPGWRRWTRRRRSASSSTRWWTDGKDASA